MDSPQTVRPRLGRALFLPVNAYKPLGTVHKKFIGAQSTGSELIAERGVCCFPGLAQQKLPPAPPAFVGTKDRSEREVGRYFICAIY